MATYKKEKKRIKIKGGNNAKIFFAGVWNSVGNIVSGLIAKSTSTVDIGFADGEGMEKGARRKCKLTLILAQTSKDEIELAALLVNSEVPIHIPNGNIEDGDLTQEFYLPRCECFDNTEISIEGDKHATIKLEFSVFPSDDGLAVCTPADDFPSDSAYIGVLTERTGVDPFYVVLEESVSLGDGAPGSPDLGPS